AVHPNSVAIVAPAGAPLAFGFASLHDQSHPTGGISVAVMTAHVLRCAGHHLLATSPAAIVPRRSEHKIGAATTVHPDAATIYAPGLTPLAWTLAVLPLDLNSPARVGVAAVAASVFGCTINGLGESSRGAKKTYCETSEYEQTCETE